MEQIPGRGLSITAMILGIVAICGSWIPFLNIASCIPAVLAIIFGGIGLMKAIKAKGPRGMAITGLVTGIATIIIAVIITSAATVGVAAGVDKYNHDMDSIKREQRIR